MRDIQKEIQENLDAIEAELNVHILLAIESGSRAWGFASPDSDYDVRFIYMQEPKEYLRIDPRKDTIEWKLDEVLDINGWDLKKALLAFAKGNPNIMEWANSPIIYREAPEWQGIRRTAMEYFSEKSALCHYYGTANTTYKSHLTGELIRYKKYFYALRPLLCCRWIERYHEAPPMEFEKLLALFDGTEPDLSEPLLAAIRDLLSRKAVTEEKDLNPQIPEIIEFIRDECRRQKEMSDGAADDHRHDFAEVNECFRAAYQVGPSAVRFNRQGEYTLDDYYALPDDRRVELIDGVIYDMAAPSNEHQLISGELSYQLQDFVKKNKGECRVYTAPFDVQLDMNERTMVQPDILVVCDREKISSRGVFGAPDMVVEILSQATAKIDATIKLLKYLEAGVREYWIVDSENRKVFIYRKEEDKVLLEMNTFDELVPVGIWEGKCRIDFPEIAREMDAWAGR